MKFKRIFLLVLDSLGVGEAMDADNYNDKGCNTLGHIIDNSSLFIPNLKKMGLLNTLLMNNSESDAFYTIARPKNKGKSSLSGHYELMCLEDSGTIKNDGDIFSRTILEKIASTIQKPLIGNIVGSSQSIIERLAKRHEDTKSLIIYTTGDANLCVAANENVIPVNELHEYCEKIRNILDNEDEKPIAVIAKPFREEEGKYIFTKDEKRFTETPLTNSVLNNLKENNYQTISIGKVSDLFNNSGINKSIKSTSNSESINKLLDIMNKNFEGLCFVNLPDFDSLYGHNRDVLGYAKALEELDVEVPIIINNLNIDDLLIITADHGNDPTMPGFSHTRENVPVILYSRSFLGSGQIDILDTFADIGATISDNFNVDKPWMGTSFLSKLK